MTPQTPQDDYEKYVKIVTALTEGLLIESVPERIALAQVSATLALAAAVRSLAERKTLDEAWEDED